MNLRSTPEQLFLKIAVNKDNPALLAGLDYWLQLGLISEAQMRRISREYLSCPLPVQTSPDSAFTERDFAPEVPLPSPPQPALTPSASGNLISRILQGLKAELSVRWLLFLGLFLVVVSSGLLAASQWENFTQVGQYLILLSYTLVFWGVGFGLSRQENLQLTAQTLQSVAFLLIPINFWAIDTFKFWSFPLGWGIILLALLSLSLLYYRYNRSRWSRLLTVNFLVLSYLHFGWIFSLIPIFSVYCALILTTVVFRLLPQESPSRNLQGRGFLIYGLSVLLIRAIFVVHLPLKDLGLAIAICGWLLENPPLNPSLVYLAKWGKRLAITLLFLGWVVSVDTPFPWQANLISFLGLQVFWQRLRREGLELDLGAIFLIGLQELFLLVALLPLSLREGVVNGWISLTQTSFFPQSLYSLTLFPYLVFFLFLADWFYRQSQSNLSQVSERLSLILGLPLTFLSLFNPAARFLNLFLSTVALIYVTHRRQPVRVPLLYFTHTVGLLALFSGVAWRLPQLSLSGWTCLLLILTVLEGLFTIPSKQTNEATFKTYWVQSCWYFCLIFAGLSYCFLWRQTSLSVLQWLAVPTTLTIVAMFSQERYKKRAAFWSSLGLIAVQVLTFPLFHTREISLGTSAIFMFLNSYYLRTAYASRLQLGFTVAFCLSSMGQIFGYPWIWILFIFTDKGILTLSAIVLCLSLLYFSLKKSRKNLAQLYQDAADFWSFLLSDINGFILGFITFLSFSLWGFKINNLYFLGSLSILGIFVYRCWRFPTVLNIYRLIVILEMIIIQSAVLMYTFLKKYDTNLFIFIATLNLIFSLPSLVIVTRLAVQGFSVASRRELSFIPLFFAGFAILWRWGQFTSYTGLILVGAGIIGLMSSYRVNMRRFISYLALSLISLGVYELTLYHLTYRGIPTTNRLIIFALVSGMIALFYRCLLSYCRVKKYRRFFHFSLKNIRLFAHLHWGLGSGIKFIAFLSILSHPSQESISLLFLSLFLPIYAFLSGRNERFKTLSHHRDNKQDIWVYLGLFDVAMTGICIRAEWQSLRILDPYLVLIVCTFALILYYLPWKYWGWNPIPWHKVAISTPILMVFFKLNFVDRIDSLNLLIIASFYLQLAITQKQIRWTYLSLACLDYLLLYTLLNSPHREGLAYAVIIGLSVLYVPQVDPLLKGTTNRNNRHYLRIIGISIILITALVGYQKTGLIPATISLGVIFLGLSLKIRAFLMVGTLTFILTILYQLVVLIFEYAFVKWIIGLMVGISLIVLGANFERRREQMLTVWQNRTQQLDEWE